MVEFPMVLHILESGLNIRNIDKFFVMTILKRCFLENDYKNSKDVIQQPNQLDDTTIDYLSAKFNSKKVGCYYFNVSCYGFAGKPCFVAVEVKIKGCGRVANLVLYSNSQGQFSQDDLFEWLGALEKYVNTPAKVECKFFGKNSF